MRMTEPIKVLIADDSDETRELVKRLIELSDKLTLFGEARTGIEVLEVLKGGLPDLVLMDINMPGMNGLETTERISRIYPSLMVIMMSVQGETEYLRKAMMSGAREYLVKPFNLEVMEETLCNTYENEMERKRLIRLKEDQNSLQGQSRVHVFFSTKGGVGKSVIALNTALDLVARNKGKVVLVDLDLQFGDLGILTNAKPLRTISEAVEDSALGDSELLSGFMETVHGVDILLAPKKPEMAEYVTEQHVQSLIKTLKKTYRYILVDTSVSFNEITLSVLDQADHIHFITTMDLLSLKNTKLGLEVLRSLHHLDKVDLVVNRTNRGPDISLQDIERSLGVKPSAAIPEEDKILLESVNQGLPIMTERKFKGSKFAKAITGLADNLAK